MATVELKVVVGSVDSQQAGKGFAPVNVQAVLPVLVAVRVNDRDNVILTAEEVLPNLLPKVRAAILADPGRFGVTVDTTCKGGKGGKAAAGAAPAMPADMAALLEQGN